MYENMKKEAVMADEIKKEDIKKEEKKRTPAWQISVKNNPDFCGIGAGGVQFANGSALIHSERMAQWFTEHDGYEVTRQ